eukprot:2946915-Rhodomonas_salina.1
MAIPGLPPHALGPELLCSRGRRVAARAGLHRNTMDRRGHRLRPRTGTLTLGLTMFRVCLYSFPCPVAKAQLSPSCPL